MRENAEVLDNSPSDYFQNHFETVPRSQKDKMLENHALWDNWPDYEYDNFLIERRKRISDVIKKGWETLIDKNFESNHFSKNSINTTMPWEHSVEDFIGKNIESENLEYKSTYQWDTKQNKQNPDVLKPIIVRTIASFLNAKGGTLLIGIDDEGKVLGIENDLNIFNGSFDDLQKNISNYIADTIGKEHIHQIGIKILPIDDKNIIRIDVEKSFTEVWIKYKGSRDEEFFVRFGPTSNRLSPKEASEYINRNFNN